jgi:hypothetical protein
MVFLWGKSWILVNHQKIKVRKQACALHNLFGRVLESFINSVGKLFFFRKSASFEFRVYKLSVEAYLKRSTTGWNEVDIFQFVLILQQCRHTGGFG